jgi:hypothetical protein
MAASSRTRSGPNVSFERGHRDRLIAPTMRKGEPWAEPNGSRDNPQSPSGQVFDCSCSPVALAGRRAPETVNNPSTELGCDGPRHRAMRVLPASLHLLGGEIARLAQSPRQF